MKITKVETLVINMPMIVDKSMLPTARGVARTSIDTLFVRIDTDEGVTGWGEGFGHRIFKATRAAIDSLIGSLCVGRDPTDICSFMEQLQRNLSTVGRNGPAMYALSAIDIALWDIAGKLAGLPLYRLLGGSPRKDLPGYASLLRYGTPRAVARHVERALKRGYRHVKMHEIELAAIRAGRDAAGPEVSLMIDCSCAWSVDESIAMAQKLQPLDLMWMEEPIWPPEDALGLARVQKKGGIPLASGENAILSDFRTMFQADAITYAQPSITKVGGVTEMRKVMALANTFGVKVVPHSAYFGPGLLASIHCIAALPQEGLIERYDCDFDLNPMHAAINPDGNGRFAVPQGPGLGVDPDPAVIEKLQVD